MEKLNLSKFITTISFFFIVISLSAQLNTPEEKADRISFLHTKLFELDNNPNNVINNILPVIESSRDSIAIHYPKRSTSNSTSTQNAILHWIISFESEANAYIRYLEFFIRQY